MTDEVMAEVTAWQAGRSSRCTRSCSSTRCGSRSATTAAVRNKAVYLALGVQADGQRDVLGLWIEQTEGAKFWLKVFNDLKTRGCQDILIAVVDGLKGLPEAIAAVFPADHGADLHRASDPQQPGLCGLEGSQAVAAGAAADLHGGQRRGGRGRAAGLCRRPWGLKYPTIVQSWRAPGST